MSDIRTYEVKTVAGTFEFDIPAEWKVTFSHVNPGAATNGHRSKGYCMRIFESKEKQRAVLTGILGFRDKSITMRRVDKPGDGLGDGTIVDDGYTEYDDEPY